MPNLVDIVEVAEALESKAVYLASEMRGRLSDGLGVRGQQRVGA